MSEDLNNVSSVEEVNVEENADQAVNAADSEVVTDDAGESVEAVNPETSDDVEVVEGEVEDADSDDEEKSEEAEDTDSDETEAEENTEDESGDKKSMFGKKKNREITKLKEQLKELTEQRVRQLAEFENFRKRSEKEKSQMFDMGAKSVIEKILPVMDNFERGLANVPEDDEKKVVYEGMQLIYKQMATVLDEIGVKPIEAEGAEFNPDLHNAVMMVEDEEKESGTVAEELQKGYTYHDTVVRHSMVKVVN
ncbi:MAG: nucleotide exchange factor GrpE [Lachnospiraceae bacterium]|nr:nucleotide exchange factor GrpE [Lachnospiraceae bacterium]